MTPPQKLKWQDLTPVDSPGVADHIAGEASRLGLRTSSFGRTPERNRAVGGAPKSYHLSSQALDLVGNSEQKKQASAHFKALYGDQITELLDEGDHLHVAWRKDAKPRQKLKWNDLTEDAAPTPKEQSQALIDELVTNRHVEPQSVTAPPRAAIPTRTASGRVRDQPPVIPLPKGIAVSDSAARSLEATFETAKREGDIDSARRYAGMLKKEFGYEVGEDGGWPYVKPPAAMTLQVGQGARVFAERERALARENRGKEELARRRADAQARGETGRLATGFKNYGGPLGNVARAIPEDVTNLEAAVGGIGQAVAGAANIAPYLDPGAITRMGIDPTIGEGARKTGLAISREASDQMGVYGREGALGDVERGIAGSAPMLGAGALAGAVGGPLAASAVVGAMGAAQTTGGLYEEALRHGLSDSEAQRVSLLGIPIGLTEMWGIGGMPAKMGKGMALRSFIKATLEEAGEEATQETIQQTLQNLTAKGFYDPDRAVLKDVPYSAVIAAVTGGVMGGGMHVGSKAVSAEAPAGRRIRHETFGEGNIDSNQAGVAEGHRRVVFDSGETKTIRVVGKNRLAHFVREPEARAAETVADTQQEGVSPATGLPPAVDPRVADAQERYGYDPERQALLDTPEVRAGLQAGADEFLQPSEKPEEAPLHPTLERVARRGWVGPERRVNEQGPPEGTEERRRGHSLELVNQAGEKSFYSIVDPEGQHIGALHINVPEGGTVGRIDWMEAGQLGGEEATLTPTAIRSLMRDVKAKHPGLEEVEGLRHSGAKARAAGVGLETNVSVKPPKSTEKRAAGAPIASETPQQLEVTGATSVESQPPVRTNRRQSLYDQLTASRRIPEQPVTEERAGLFQSSGLTTVETDRVVAKLNDLKQRGQDAEEYLRQPSLTGQHELSESQQALLRELAAPKTRRAPIAAEQGGLFAEGVNPTVESRLEQQKEEGGFGGQFGSGGLFQTDNPHARKIISDIVGDLASDGLGFREAAKQFREEFGPSEEYGHMFEEAWDAQKGVKKRGKQTFESAVSEKKPAQSEQPLTSAVIRLGRLKSTGFSGKGEKKDISPKEGGRIGLFSDKGLPVEDMIRTLKDEGWDFGEDDIDALYAALRDEAGGKPHYSSTQLESQADEEFEQMSRDEFVEQSDHSIMARAFDNPTAEEYKEWVDAYDAALNPRRQPSDEDIQFFKEVSRDLGLSDDTVNRHLARADVNHRNETAVNASAETASGREAQSVRSADEFRKALVIAGFPESSAEATAALLDQFDQTYSRLSGEPEGSIIGRIRVGTGGSPEGLQEAARAVTNFGQDGTALIRSLTNPNESSAAHELQHVVAPHFFDLSEQLRTRGDVLPAEGKQFVRDMNSMARWMGLNDAAEFNALHQQYVDSTLKGGTLRRYVNAQEKAARGFEQYLRTGKAPSPFLERVFAQFKEWLHSIYQTVAGSDIDVGMTQEQASIWDRLLGGTGDRDPKETGIKNAVTTEEREARGQRGIEGALTKSFGESLADGQELVDRSPDLFRSQVADWASKPRALTDSEDAALAYDRMKLYNEHRQAIKILDEAIESGVDEDVARADAHLLAIEEQISTNDEASRKTGTENGRGLNARKLMIREDYSLAAMLQRAKVATGEKTLSPEMRKKITDMARDIEKYQAELHLAQTRITELESQTARREKVENWRARSKGRRSKAAVVADMEAVKAQFAKLAQQGKGLLQADKVRESSDPLSPELRSLVKQFARLSIEAGARTAEEVNAQAHGMVSEHFPEITARETADIWSEYGKVAKLSKDEIDVAMREAKRQQRLLTALEDAESGESPQRTGLQRDKPTQRVRELTRAVQQEMRKQGIRTDRTVNPEDQWKTTQEAVKTRLRNEIEDLDKQIETGKTPEPAAKLKKAYDDETIALMAERDVLKRQANDPTVQNKADLRRKITEAERKLREGDLARTESGKFPPEIYDDAEATRLRGQLKGIQAQVTAARNQPRIQEQLRARIADLQRRIRERDFSQAAREVKPVDPVTASLRAQRDDLNKTLREMEGPTARTFEQRVEAAERGVEKSIENLDERIRQGKLDPDKRTSSLWTAKLGQLQKQRAALAKTLKDMRDAAKPTRDPDVAKLKAYKKAVEKSIREYERRLAEGDFTTTKRKTLDLDPEAQELAAKRDQVKKQFQNEIRKQAPGKWYRNISGLRKSWMLSGVSTQFRNIVGTAGYQVFDEVSRLTGAPMDALVSTVTGQRALTGPSPVAMLDSVIHMYKAGGAKAKQVLKQGATAEEMAQHQFHQEIDTGLKALDVASNAVFRFMSASDRVFREQSYRRNLLDRALAQAKTEARIDKGLDVRQRAKDLAANPDAELKGAAEHDSLVATFNNSNKLSDAIKRGRSALTPAQNFAIDIIMPFDRTPTNVILRVLQASPAGYFGNVYQLARSVRHGMSVEEQRQFSQTFGRATTGTTVMALGWYLASLGLLTGGGDEEDRKAGIEPNSLKIGGKTYPIAPFSPLGNLMALGASVYEETHRDKAEAGKLADALLKPFSDQPLLRGSGQLGEVLRRPSREGSRFVGQTAYSFVPFGGLVRDIGKLTDPEKRKPERSFGMTGIKEQFQANVPGWRQKLAPKGSTTRKSGSSGYDYGASDKY